MKSNLRIMGVLILTALLTVFLTACGSGGGGGGGDNTTNTGDTLKVLASNVIFGTASANAAQMAVGANSVDTETKVLAENVILDNSNISISSENVQDAFEEVVPVLEEILIGTWNAKSYNNGFTGEIGSITFNADGTFNINDGTVSVIGGCAISMCSSQTGNWEVIDNSLIRMTLEGFDPQYPYPVNYTNTKMTLIRSFNLTIIEKSE